MNTERKLEEVINRREFKEIQTPSLDALKSKSDVGAAAWSTWIMALNPVLLQYAHQRVPEAIAEELVQDAWMNVYAQREAILHGEKLNGYVMQALKNKITDHHKSAHTRLSFSAPIEDFHGISDSGDVESEVLRAEQKDLVTKGIAALPRRHQESLVYFAHGLTNEEVAERTGQKIGAAKAQRHRATRALGRQPAIRTYNQESTAQW